MLNIVRFASENGIIAIGMTLVILTGGIDLSVGAVLALCAVGAAACMTRYGFGTAETVLVVLALGGLVGVVNGLVTTRFHIQSFITTLAMLGVARGIASLWSGGYAIPLALARGRDGAAELQGDVRRGSRSARTLGALSGLLLPRRRLDRLLPVASHGLWPSRLRGRRQRDGGAALRASTGRPVKIVVFACSGLLAGLAALLHAALVNQGSHIDGNGYELNAIAAVVIGGTSLAGGMAPLSAP